MRFSEEFIQRVRDGSDLVKVIGEYVVLKRRGRNFVGLCPFHNEKTPSFNVSPETQLYHCFGCGAGGNVFTFIMEIEGLGFPEAAAFLAEKAGIAVEEKEVPAEELERNQNQRRLYQLTELTAKYMAYTLQKAPEATKARQYVVGRGISAEAAHAFALGYAKGDWDDLLRLAKNRGFTEEELLQAGLVLPRRNGGGYYDRFRDRLIFPIQDLQGRVVAFGGRSLTKDGDGPKYLNSPETDIFHKGSQLYGLNLAKNALRQGEPAIITEGYMDVIALHTAGFSSAIASLGTSLTEGQVRLLSRFTSRILIAYDGDTAGAAATWRGLEMLNRYGFDVKVIDLAEGEDPDSLIRKYGPEAFQSAVSRALPLTDYKVNRTLSGFDLRQVNERIKAARALLPILVEVEGAVAREAYIELVARKIGISTGALKRELHQYQGRLRKSRDNKRNIFPDYRNNISERSGPSAIRVRPAAQAPIEMAALKLLLSRAEIAADLLTEENLKYFTNPAIKQIILAIMEIAASGRTVSPAEMMDRFTDDQAKKIFSELNFSEELPGLIENPHDCMSKLRTHYFQEELKDLIQNLVNIRSSGQVTELNQLLVQYIHLYKDAQKSIGERGER